MATFMPAPHAVSVTFDTNISSVEMVWSLFGTVQPLEVFLTSGEAKRINCDMSTDYVELTPILTGYQLDTFQLTDGADYWTATKEGKGIKLVPTSNNAGQPFSIAITSKPSGGGVLI